MAELSSNQRSTARGLCFVFSCILLAAAEAACFLILLDLDLRRLRSHLIHVAKYFYCTDYGKYRHLHLSMVPVGHRPVYRSPMVVKDARGGDERTANINFLMTSDISDGKRHKTAEDCGRSGIRGS